MTSDQVVGYIGEVQAASDTILATVGTAAPGVALPAALAETIVDLIAQLASKAIAAYHEAQGIPITVETVRDLLPSGTPLSPPDAS